MIVAMGHDGNSSAVSEAEAQEVFRWVSALFAERSEPSYDELFLTNRGVAALYTVLEFRQGELRTDLNKRSIPKQIVHGQTDPDSGDWMEFPPGNSESLLRDFLAPYPWYATLLEWWAMRYWRPPTREWQYELLAMRLACDEHYERLIEAAGEARRARDSGLDGGRVDDARLREMIEMSPLPQRILCLLAEGEGRALDGKILRARLSDRYEMSRDWSTIRKSIERNLRDRWGVKGKRGRGYLLPVEHLPTVRAFMAREEENSE